MIENDRERGRESEKETVGVVGDYFSLIFAEPDLIIINKLC